MASLSLWTQVTTELLCARHLPAREVTAGGSPGVWAGLSSVGDGHLACNILPLLPATNAGFAPWFLPSPHKRRRGGVVKKKGATSFLRFWPHEQLTHISHSFEIWEMFVEAEDHSSALYKLIVSIKDLNDCHVQIHGEKG